MMTSGLFIFDVSIRPTSSSLASFYHVSTFFSLSTEQHTTAVRHPRTSFISFLSPPFIFLLNFLYFTSRGIQRHHSTSIKDSSTQGNFSLVKTKAWELNFKLGSCLPTANCEPSLCSLSSLSFLSFLS